MAKKKQESSGCIGTVLFYSMMLFIVWPFKLLFMGLGALIDIISGENEKAASQKETAAKFGETSVPDSQPMVVHEKEIITQTKVITKIECRYCKTRYDETLPECPKCGAADSGA